MEQVREVDNKTSRVTFLMQCPEGVFASHNSAN